MRWKYGLVLAVGVLVGGLGRALLSGEQISLPAFDERLLDQPSTPAVTRPTVADDDARLRRLENSFAELKRQLDSRDAGAAVTTTAPKESPALEPLPSAEEAERRASVAHAARLESFSSEPLDAAWAASTSSAISSELGATIRANQLQAQVSVECRTTQCVASVKWPDFETAKREFMRVDTMAVPCERHMFLAVPEREEDVYTASLVLNCVR